MAFEKREVRHVTITYDYAVNVKAPPVQGRGRDYDDEEFDRAVIRAIQRELEKEGR